MIAHLHGRLVEKYPTYCVVDCNGVGYHVNISLNTFSKLGDSESVKVLTHLVVREDAQILYGFHNEEERSMFRNLVSVSGVGAATALTILSAMTPAEVTQSIAANDVDTFKRVKGIGAKSAQRIIVDLKDKLEKEGLVVMDNFSGSNNTNKNEALSALVTLGFDKRVAGKVLEKCVQEQGSDVGVEELVRFALKNM